MATQRFENIRLSLNYDLAFLYRDRSKDTPTQFGRGYAEEMHAHVLLDAGNGNGKTQRELILGGINLTPAQHVTEWLNRNIKMRQSIVSIRNVSDHCYDILVENHA